MNKGRFIVTSSYQAQGARSTQCQGLNPPRHLRGHPLVLLSGIFGFYLTVTQRQSLDAGIRDKAAGLSLALSRELETQIQLLSVLSESPRLDPPLQKNEFTLLAKRLLDRVRVWQMLRVTDRDGIVLMVVPDREPCKLVRQVVEADRHATMVRTARPVVGRMVTGPKRLPAFPVRVPVVRNSEVVYWLTSVIRPDAIGRIVAPNGLRSEWVGWLVDGAGQLVYSSFGDTTLLAHDANELVELNLDKGDLVIGRLRDGSSVRSASALVQGTEWTLHVGMPLETYASAYRSGWVVLGMTVAATIALSVFAAFLFLRELAARRRDEAAVASWQRLDALGKLAGGVAHDLNNLLMVFQSGADSISRRPNDAGRTAVILDGMRQAVVHAKTLTQRLLSFSRRSNTDAVTVRLDEQLALMNDALVQASQDLVQFDFEYPAGTWPVKIDPEALETALINLVTNAREAMPNGGKVRVSVRNVQDLSLADKRLDGAGVALAVEDEGRSVPLEDVHRVVEPFFTTKQDATGLGLSQVAAFARRSGGTLDISSVPGRGSIVTILLPRDPSSDEIALTAGTEALPSFVLVVDDTPSSLASARQTLEGANVKTLGATHGRKQSRCWLPIRSTALYRTSVCLWCPG